MSLQCEGDGAVCYTCGHFDFLPLKCNHCGNMFCGEHIKNHNIPGSEEACAAAYLGRVLPVTSMVQEGATEPRHACAICGSPLCVLIPCDLCQRDFCAIHRFHEHSDNHGERRRVQGTNGHDTTPFPKDVEEAFAHICGRYSPGRPLVLQPPAFRGTMLPVTALMCEVDDTGGTIKAVAVISLSVAAEMSVGQLLDRCTVSLVLPPSHLLKQPMFHISFSDRAVVDQIPLSLSASKADLSNRDVLLVVQQRGDPTEESERGVSDQVGKVTVSVEALENALTQLLSLALSDGLRPGSRLHSAASRIRLRSLGTKASKRGTSPPSQELSQSGQLPHCECTNRVKVSSVSDREVVRIGTHQQCDIGGTPWPFLRPPPLDEFIFSHTRMNPRRAAPKEPPSASIIVAVFVADCQLSREVAPFCISLNKELSIGRVLDIIREIVDEVAGPRPGPGWNLFNLTTGELLTVPPLSSRSDLRDRDILFFGEVFSEALRAEVVRLREVKGKPLMALKMKMMKSCALM
ncbi:putative zinc finger protein [Trypanosoma equiperdum]|uniref:Predicted zinc finger protein n=2 Tax=Trypanozoon TaxID=39700 RepID=A0A1G4HZZ4_TRYEQ|nr:predicted zinc finger protein [Trypanosoma equiperdum]